MAAGMASGNPALVGGGAILQTLDSARAAKQQQEDAKRLAYLEQIKGQQEGLTGMANVFNRGIV